MEATLTKVNGKVSMDKSLEFMASTLPNGTYTVSIKRKSEKRTLNQNALMWKWFECVAYAYREYTGDEDWDAQTIHDGFCTKFLRKTKIIQGVPTEIVRGTSKLSKLEMSEFMNKIKVYCAREHGIILPLPEDESYKDFIDAFRGKY
jgi:hypothetical protein